MRKPGFLKFQEATGSLSGPIYTPINAGRNTTELMLKKSMQLISSYTEVLSFPAGRAWSKEVLAVGSTQRHEICVLGKEGPVGEPLATCEQSRASPEHSQRLRNTLAPPGPF